MIVSIASDKLQAQVSAHGAELVRLQDEAGRDLLWDGDPAFWAGRSPLLFPVIGRVRNGRIRVNGVEYEHPKHGLARTATFEVVETRPAHCRFRFRSNENTLARYPFPFVLHMSYRVTENVLTAEAAVTNPGEGSLPVSFGFHPAFRWPLPYGAPREAHEIRFEHDEHAPIRRLVGGLMGETTYPSPVRDGRLALRDDLFARDALIFDHPKSRVVTLGAPGSRAVRVAFPHMPHLGIWTKPGAPFICIEPWQGFDDPVNFDGEFADKPGLAHIGPGATRTFAIAISLTAE